MLSTIFGNWLHSWYITEDSRLISRVGDLTTEMLQRPRHESNEKYIINISLPTIRHQCLRRLCLEESRINKFRSTSLVNVKSRNRNYKFVFCNSSKTVLLYLFFLHASFSTTLMCAFSILAKGKRGLVSSLVFFKMLFQLMKTCHMLINSPICHRISHWFISDISLIFWRRSQSELVILLGWESSRMVDLPEMLSTGAWTVGLIKDSWHKLPTCRRMHRLPSLVKSNGVKYPSNARYFST